MWNKPSRKVRKAMEMKASEKIKNMGWDILILPYVKELDEEEFRTFCREKLFPSLSKQTTEMMSEIFWDYGNELLTDHKVFSPGPEYKKSREFENVRWLSTALRNMP